MKKDVFENSSPTYLVMWSLEKCLRMWRKITSKQKEIKDQNNNSGNDRNTLKFFDELSACLRTQERTQQ